MSEEKIHFGISIRLHWCMGLKEFEVYIKSEATTTVRVLRQPARVSLLFSVEGFYVYGKHKFPPQCTVDFSIIEAEN